MSKSVTPSSRSQYRYPVLGPAYDDYVHGKVGVYSPTGNDVLPHLEDMLFLREAFAERVYVIQTLLDGRPPPSGVYGSRLRQWLHARSMEASDSDVGRDLIPGDSWLPLSIRWEDSSNPYPGLHWVSRSGGPYGARRAYVPKGERVGSDSDSGDYTLPDGPFAYQLNRYRQDGGTYDASESDESRHWDPKNGTYVPSWSAADRPSANVFARCFGLVRDPEGDRPPDPGTYPHDPKRRIIAFGSVKAMYEWARVAKHAWVVLDGMPLLRPRRTWTYVHNGNTKGPIEDSPYGGQPEHPLHDYTSVLFSGGTTETNKLYLEYSYKRKSKSMSQSGETQYDGDDHVTGVRQVGDTEENETSDGDEYGMPAYSGLAWDALTVPLYEYDGSDSDDGRIDAVYEAVDGSPVSICLWLHVRVYSYERNTKASGGSKVRSDTFSTGSWPVVVDGCTVTRLEKEGGASAVVAVSIPDSSMSALESLAGELASEAISRAGGRPSMPGYDMRPIGEVPWSYLGDDVPEPSWERFVSATAETEIDAWVSLDATADVVIGPIAFRAAIL